MRKRAKPRNRTPYRSPLLAQPRVTRAQQRAELALYQEMTSQPLTEEQVQVMPQQHRTTPRRTSGG